MTTRMAGCMPGKYIVVLATQPTMLRPSLSVLLCCQLLRPTLPHPTESPPTQPWSSPSRAAYPRPDTIPEVQYTGPTLASSSRNLSAVLAQTVSVLDYGATADCLCKLDSQASRQQRGAQTIVGVSSKPIPPFKEACCPHDSTAAFNAALASGGVRGIEVSVPTGSYRIDGTVLLKSGGLRFAAGSTLIRSTLSASAEPILRIDGTHTSTSGRGSLIMMNAAPRGIVNIG